MKRYYFAVIVTLIYIPLITISAELFAPLKAILKDTFWHHWLGKSILVVIIFVVARLIAQLFKNPELKTAESDASAITWITVLAMVSALSIFIFFVVEYLNLPSA